MEDKKSQTLLTEASEIIIPEPAQTAIMCLYVDLEDLLKMAAAEGRSFSCSLITWAHTHNVTFALYPGSQNWEVSGSTDNIHRLQARITEVLSPKITKKLKKKISEAETMSLPSVDVNKIVWHYIREFCTSELFDVIHKPVLHFKPLDSNSSYMHFYPKVPVSAMMNVHNRLKLLCQRYTSKLHMCTFSMPLNSPFDPQPGAMPRFGVIFDKLPDGKCFLYGPHLAVRKALNNFSELSKCEEGIREDEVGGPKENASNLMQVFIFKKGIHVNLCFGDIIHESVDAIVTIPNSFLEPADDITKMFATESGEEVREWCHTYVNKNGEVPVGSVLISSAGKLQASKIFHAVGPNWKKYNKNQKEKCINILTKTYESCFTLADKMGFVSIALPLISVENFGVSVTKSATCLFNAVDLFSKDNSYHLRSINLIESRVEDLETVINIFEERFTRSGIQDNELEEKNYMDSDGNIYHDMESADKKLRQNYGKRTCFQQ